MEKRAQTHHAERVAEALRVELDEILNYELADPRLIPLVITEVLLSPDMRLALIRVALGEDAARGEQALQALAGARGFVRRQLSERLGLFRVPEIEFEADMTPALRARAAPLLRRVRKGRPREDGLTGESEKKPAQ